MTSQVIYSPYDELSAFAPNSSSSSSAGNYNQSSVDPAEATLDRAPNSRSPPLQTDNRERRCMSCGTDYSQHHRNRSVRRIDRISSAASLEMRGLLGRKPCLHRFQSPPTLASSNDESELNSERDETEDEPVWIRRSSPLPSRRTERTRRRPDHHHQRRSSKAAGDCDLHKELPIIETSLDDVCRRDDVNRDSVCGKAVAMATRKQAIAEWQIMATVIDRLLFWVFLLATVVTYLVILVGLPLLKRESNDYDMKNESTVSQRTIVRPI